MTLNLNEDRLVKIKLQGTVSYPSHWPWSVGHDGVSRMTPSVGGITLNFRVGDSVAKFVSDHLEPGVSTTTEPDPKKRASSSKDRAYNSYSCIGNTATIISGEAKGATGIVTGHHGGVEHVIIDFDEDTMSKMSYDDKIMIIGYGSGLKIEEFPDISIFSLDPTLLKLINPTVKSSKLLFPVTKIIPACLMGSGLGTSEAYKGDYDIQTSDPILTAKLDLYSLKLGDLVAIEDHKNTYGPSYTKGAISIGVIVHGDSHLCGHGPGVQVIMSSCGEIEPIINTDSNIGKYLKIGRYSL